jgi:hypothetical protein
VVAGRSATPDHSTRAGIQKRDFHRVTSHLHFNLTHHFARNHHEETSNTAKMGIKQLFSIIKDEAPDSFKEGDIKNQFGRKVAIVRRLRILTIAID